MKTVLHKQKSKRQQGFVLILCLVLLTVMTLVAVSSMNSASVELKAAANSQHHNVAFHAVQSLLDYAISDDASGFVDFQTNSATIQNVSYTVSNASNLAATVEFAGCAKAEGSSLEDDRGFNYNFYEIKGSGSNKTGTASSSQGEGVRYPSASC